MEGAVRSIFKILTLLSLLASIGSFIIAAAPLFNEQNSNAGNNLFKQLVVNKTDIRDDSDFSSKEGAVRFCIVVIAVCGAGLAVIRIFR
jgi:hypothetical protein